MATKSFTCGTCACTFNDSTGALVINGGQLVPTNYGDPISPLASYVDIQAVKSITMQGTFTGTLNWAFAHMLNLTSFTALSANVSAITDMEYTFVNIGISTLDLSSWDTSKVTLMFATFANCNSLTSVNLSGWNTYNVASMEGMFDGCTKLTSITLGSNFDTAHFFDSSFSHAVNPYNFMGIATKIPASNKSKKLTARSDLEFASMSAAEHAGTWQLKIPISAVFSAAHTYSAGLVGSCTYSGTTGTVTYTLEYSNVGVASYSTAGSSTGSNGVASVTYKDAPTNALDLRMTLTDGAGYAIYYNMVTPAANAAMSLDGEGNLTVASSVTANGEKLVSWQTVYPVGAIYLSYVSTSPASLFGGSWTQITGKFLRMANDVSTGGADTHTHAYGVRSHIYWGVLVGTDNEALELWNGSSWVQRNQTGTNNTYTNNNLVNATDSRAVDISGVVTNTASASSMPAYQDLYAWRRTA